MKRVEKRADSISQKPHHLVASQPPALSLPGSSRSRFVGLVPASMAGRPCWGAIGFAPSVPRSRRQHTSTNKD